MNAVGLADMNSFDTDSLVPGQRFYALDTARAVGRLYWTLHRADLRSEALRPALWAFPSKQGRQVIQYTYTFTEADYQAYRAQANVVFLGDLEVERWISG